MTEPQREERPTRGLVLDMPEDLYHGTLALSASGAWLLAQECPALYWHTSPFNPGADAEQPARIMDIGTALHLAVLEPDRRAERIVPIIADSYRTNAAKEQRDAAYSENKIPLLPADLVKIEQLRAAVMGNRHAAALVDGADREASYFWHAGTVPCKARADIISPSRRIIGDLKVSASASPEFFRRRAYQAGHFLRAPWYIDGFQVATGHPIEQYYFIVVARDPPHLVTVCRLDERALAWGRMMIRKALHQFAACQARDEWPGYVTEPVTLELPTFAEYSLADREAAGEFSDEQ